MHSIESPATNIQIKFVFSSVRPDWVGVELGKLSLKAKLKKNCNGNWVPEKDNVSELVFRKSLGSMSASIKTLGLLLGSKNPRVE
jgi:hypothetical protein